MIKRPIFFKSTSLLSTQIRASLLISAPLYQYSRAITRPNFSINQENTFQFLTSFDYNIDEKGKHVPEIELGQEELEPLDKATGPLSFDKALFYLKNLVKKAKVTKISPARLENIVAGIESNLNKMTMDDATLITWAFARLNYFPESLASPIEAFALKDIEKIETRDLAILLWSFAKMNKGSETFWEVVTSKVEEVAPEMSLIDLVNSTWAIATKEINKDSLWQTLEDNLDTYMKNLNDCQSISNLMISFAKMNRGDDKFWRKLENQCFQVMTHMEGQALANSIWALAKRDRLIFIKGNALETVILSKLNKMKDLEIASIAWNFAKLYKGSTNFWTVVYQRLSRILKSDPKHITMATLCTCAWTLSNLKISEDQDWEIIEKHVILKESEIKINHLHSLIASFATKGKGSTKLWEIFEKKTVADFSNFEPKTLSGIVWAFATMERGDQEFWRIIQERLAQNLQKLTNQGIALSFWAITKSGKHDPEIFEKIMQEILARFDELNGTDLGMVMWSLGRLKLNSISVEMIISKMKQKLMSGMELNIIDLAHFVFALNELEKGDQELWEFIERHLDKFMHEIKEEGWVIFLKAACMHANFSDNFWISAESGIMNEIKKYSGISVVNIMRSFYKKKIGSDKFWFMLEEETKSKLADLDGHLLGECASIISRKKIGENDFWERFETTVLDKLDKIRSRDKAKIIAALGTEAQGSMNIWNILQENVKRILMKEKVMIPELLDFLSGFSQKKKGDHEFWNLLEKRILEAMKIEKNRNTRNVGRIIKDFASIKRGSREFWKVMTGYLIDSIEKIPLKVAMSLVRSLDIVREIDEHEKELLFRHCIDRVLKAEESFGGYLTQLSFEGRICKKISDEDLNILKQKVVDYSGKNPDVQFHEQLNQAVQRIIKTRESLFVRE